MAKDIGKNYSKTAWLRPEFSGGRLIRGARRRRMTLASVGGAIVNAKKRGRSIAPRVTFTLPKSDLLFVLL